MQSNCTQPHGSCSSHTSTSCPPTAKETQQKYPPEHTHELQHLKILWVV